MSAFLKRWHEWRTRRFSMAWKIGTPMSGGFKRMPYGSWSFGCRFGGILFTRFVDQSISSSR